MFRLRAAKSSLICRLITKRFAAGTGGTFGGRVSHELMCETEPLPSDIAPIPPVGQTAGLVVLGPLGSDSIAERLKVLPLAIVEEVPVPPVILTEIELLMKAWHEDHARNIRIVSYFVRSALFLISTAVFLVAYFANRSYQRKVKGSDNMPKNMKIGSIVYLDFGQAGVHEGRVVIGLANETCPLYCEYFHRLCTASGGKGDSFAGARLVAMVPDKALLFGDGIDAVHPVEGYNPRWLPTESTVLPWRGAVSSIMIEPGKESPNFVLHMASMDTEAQVFGIILGGYDVLERISNFGSSGGSEPRTEWVIESCGELCTLDKSKITALPWGLYESISNGYDTFKFGEEAPPELVLPPSYAHLAEAPIPIVTEVVGELVKRDSPAEPFGSADAERI